MAFPVRVSLGLFALMMFGSPASPIVTAAEASSPPLAFAGAKRLNVLCNVAGGPGVDHVALSAQLCDEVKRLAAKGSPIPVETIALGDPAVLAADSVTLLVHASVAQRGGERLLAFNLRPYRVSSEQASVLFGSPPRVAAISSSASGPALRAALDAALAETLPWRGQSNDARQLVQRP